MLASQKKHSQEYEALKKEYEDFIYIVSHDLKSPMRAISNITTWIEEDLEEENTASIPENFKLLKNRVGRLENMMNALLELSRVNKLEEEFTTVNLKEFIDEVANVAVGKSTANVVINYELSQYTIAIAVNKIQKVLTELIENAIRFNTNEKKDIFVTIQETELNYEITVADNGPGILKEIENKIFNIFYTASSKDHFETTGAGLTISKKIMQTINGDLVFDSNEMTTFKMIWPKINL
ncbi:sensor histidine kinase [Flavobacterium frigidarium]|jgi:light-regulated signal transduction histidine kinase (bacteriophytochrome)|uniref:sensor histidine kinase n=1 Tax=Flavobacterium frigidarium TaxID=99286 RepID=UPI00047EBFAC|nr:HAMP domain-containing sensor histidine kinase [Flavobacterium frigidarium]